MVQVQADGQAGLDDGGLHQLDQIGVVGISTSTLGHLKDQRGVDLLGGLSDALDDLHVIDIKGTDGIPAVISLLGHFLGSYERHNSHLLYRNHLRFYQLSLKISRGRAMIFGRNRPELQIPIGIRRVKP